jgi:dTDP-4-dehydrorhamnose reductase
VYIPDIARAICRFVENIVENNLFCGKVRGKHQGAVEKTKYFGQIFHCGGAERLNRVEFVERCCAVLGVETAKMLAKRMEDVPNYTTRVGDVSLDSTTLKSALHWEQTPLEKAFMEMKESFGMVF